MFIWSQYAQMSYASQALNYLKTHNKFYEDISISESLSSKEMINFSVIDKHQDVTESIHTKIISNETEYGSVEDPLSMHRTGSNETVLVLEIPSIINDKYVIIAPGEGKKTASTLDDEFCEEQAFPYHLPKGKFGYKAPRDIPISPAQYFNQRLLNFNQYFGSDADYIFFARLVHEQHHLLSSINFAMQKIKPGTLTAGTVKSSFKGTIEKFVAKDKDNAFSFMSSVKGTPAYWKQFLFDALAMVKQLAIFTYFLTLSCADLRWEELSYIINKLNNLGRGIKKFK